MPLEMEQVVGQAWERQRWLIDKHEATLEHPASWPPVDCYAPWIEAVWSNLLSNAIKYGGKPPKVSVGYDRLANDTLWLCLHFLRVPKTVVSGTIWPNSF